MTNTNQTIQIAAYQPHPRNYNRHSPLQVQRIAASLKMFGQVRSVVVCRGHFLAGHGVREAALSLGWKELRADVLPDDYPEELALAYLAADNELSRLSDPDNAQLAQILEESRHYDDGLLAAIGYDDKEFEALLAEVERDAGLTAEPSDAEPQIDRAAELLAVWQVEPGDLWRIGDHRLICGDCRDSGNWARLLSAAGVDKVNGVFTSPPYAMQRKDQYGGVPTDEYVEWWDAVQANVKGNLADDGSFLVNIKAHCEDGQRVLYCMDLVLAMVRRWEWKYNDEFCWTHGGIPGEVHTKLKNQFEPIYQFFKKDGLKARLDNVRHYSKSIPQGGGDNMGSQQGTGAAGKDFDVSDGLAYPGNVLSLGKSKEALGHAAAFPVALPDFFIRAYSDPGDVWLDPFCGSGTTLVAAQNNDRRGLGFEMLPKYASVILQRMQDAFPTLPIERISNG